MINKTIDKLVPDAKYKIIGEQVYKNITWLDDRVMPSEEEFNIVYDEVSKEVNKINVIDSINELSKNLTERIKTSIATKFVPVDQQERYDAKRRAADADNTNYFLEEAELLGKDPAALLADAKQKSIDWTLALDTAFAKIDALRIKLQVLTEEGKIDLVKFIIEDIKSIEVIPVDTNLVEYFVNVTVRYEESVVV